MKKRILVPAIIGVMGIGGLMTIALEETSFASNDKILTIEEVKKKALAEVDGIITDIDFEKSTFKNYYEVEIITDETEYDLKLDATSGKLLKKEKEPLDYDDLYDDDNDDWDDRFDEDDDNNDWDDQFDDDDDRYDD